eukprot:TRINITY_DN29483_c0_g1_i1.p1 TRINITY_DN29483_c0_g1~~TRINITY_DN29483_c0_g1_i1.p1  ORF type:complete len:314 (+),score=71.14 TRINITY_DN29483_c0_g1_i1:52-942(+)
MGPRAVPIPLLAAAVAAGCLLLAAVPGCRADTSDVPRSFPQEFSVMLGTTITFEDGRDAVAQAGMIYFDGANQLMRIDTWYHDYSYTFLGRYDDKRIYVITNGKCVFSKANGTLLPYTLPVGSVRHSEWSLVRNTLVAQFDSVVKGPAGLQAVAWFVSPLNKTHAAPWRTVITKSRHPELPPNSEVEVDMEDAERTGEEVEPFHTSSHELVAVDPVSQVITDYYNFNPATPDPNVFAIPAICEKATEPLFEGTEAADDDQVFHVHKRIVDIAVFRGERPLLTSPEGQTCNSRAKRL